MVLLKAFGICKKYFIAKMYIKYERIRNIIKLASRAMPSKYMGGMSGADSVLSPVVLLYVQR